MKTNPTPTFAIPCSAKSPRFRHLRFRCERSSGFRCPPWVKEESRKARGSVASSGHRGQASVQAPGRMGVGGGLQGPYQPAPPPTPGRGEGMSDCKKKHLIATTRPLRCFEGPCVVRNSGNSGLSKCAWKTHILPQRQTIYFTTGCKDALTVDQCAHTGAHRRRHWILLMDKTIREWKKEAVNQTAGES